jgi:phospholipid/cholesterol/gamma-HCH transport system permease protein
MCKYINISSIIGLGSALATLFIHTYFGYTATGGPAGVGLATGRAVRASLIVVVSVTLLVSLAIYGTSGNFNLSG